MVSSDNKFTNDILSNIIDFTDDAIIGLSALGVITGWNRGAEKMFGFLSSEVSGEHISLIIPKDKVAEEEAILAQILQGEYTEHYETERKNKSGSTICVSVTLLPVKDANGKISGVLTISRDITIRKQAEEVQARMADIINFSDDAIITKTLEGIITSWNRGAEKVFGYHKKEAIGKHISMLIPEGRLDEEPKIIDKIKMGEYIDHYETERKRKDGTLIHISLTVSPIKDSKGRITGVSKIARDITLRKKAEEMQSWFASIVKFSDDAIISKTLDGIISSWNRGAQNIFGYTREEVIGKHVSILIPPGYLDEEPAIIERIRRGDYIDHYETVRVRKDGTTIPISLTVSPIRDADGNIVGVSKIARDISARKRSDELMARLAAVVNHSDDAIITKTLDGIITSWNRGAQRIFGYLPEEAIGKHVSILIPAGRIDEEPQIIEKVTRGDTMSHYETERVRKDGSIVHISLTVSAIKDPHGRVIGASKIARDISEKKKREQEILELNRELEAFSYSASHDLKAPLRVIKSYSEILKNEYASHLDEQGQNMLAKIMRNCDRMNKLIENLFAFSQSARQTLTHTTINTHALVSDLLDELVAPQRNRDIHVTLHELQSISGDENMLRHVWQNLISNALKYTGKKNPATIEIGCQPSGNEMVFYIRDNGVGFDMHHSGKLFHAFERLHNSSDFEGTGIGLAIVQRIIARHGGRVWAEGNLNEGAVFYFSLPAASAQ